MRKDQGLTLIELMIGLSITAILLLMAVPNFNSVLQNNRMESRANQLMGALHLARSEAIKRHSVVTVCASQNGTTCASSNWSSGWLVFVDAGTVGTVDAGDTILQSTQVTANQVDITLTGMTAVPYLATGLIDTSGITTTTTTTTTSSNISGTGFAFCDASRSGETGRYISLWPSGRVTLSQYTCS